MWRLLPIIACLGLAACDNYVMMQDPLTKQTADCHKTFPDSLNTPMAVDDCVEAYESLGFKPVGNVLYRN